MFDEQQLSNDADLGVLKGDNTLDCAQSKDFFVRLNTGNVSMRMILLVIVSLLISVNALTVHIVPHTHDDVGWLKNVDEYYVGMNPTFSKSGVQYIIDTVVTELSANPNRTFVYVEQAFFQRWWRQQTPEKQDIVRAHVKRGALLFINGGWCMHDEATTHYIDMVDQTALGHKYIHDEFGASANPRIGWQIDPFGHSATHVSLLTADLGFDAMYFARLDWQERTQRIARQDLEWVWRASPSRGPDNQVFAGAFQTGSYSTPNGFCWDQICTDAPIQDDPRLGGYNVQSRVDDFVRAALNQAKGTRGDLDTMNIMMPFGDDFMYENANKFFKNIDKLINAVNADGRIKVLYSNPLLYTLAKNAEPNQWSIRTDDAMPYASSRGNYWTGYFTSRPALKRYVRVASDFLLITRQWEALTSPLTVDALQSPLTSLWEELGVAQHHDAIAGTERQEVAYDYAMRIARGIDAADKLLEALIANKTVQESGAVPPLFTFCPLANVSICPATQGASHVGDMIAVLIHNPLARTIRRMVRLPFNAADASVVDGRTGAVVPSQVISVMKTIGDHEHSSPMAIWFFAELPAVGYNTYLVTTTKLLPSQAGNIVHRMRMMSEPLSSPRQRPSSTAVTTNSVPTKRSADVQISNDYWTLTFDGQSGLLSTLTDLKTSQVIPFNQSFYWYASLQNNADNDADSDPYTFSPNVSTAEPYALATVVAVEVVTGTLTTEVRQVFNSWVSQIVRLTTGSPVITFEMTVGHIDTVTDYQGKEIVTRYSSSIASGGVWYTDSNGREMQRRQRNARAGWKWDYSDEPVSGNYVPLNAVAWLADDELTMAVVTDRSQGITSLHDGELEVMLHRRLTHDVFGSVLNETDPDGQGLTVVITHHLIIGPTEIVPAMARRTQSQTYAEPHIAISTLSQTSVKDYIATHNVSQSLLPVKLELPPNIELITLQSWNPQQLLIRIAHTFGVGEDKLLSLPVTVDLSAFIIGPLKSITEMTLTANDIAGTYTPLKWNVTTSRGQDFRLQRAAETEYFYWHQKQQNTTVPAVFNVTMNPMQVRTFLYTFSLSA